MNSMVAVSSDIDLSKLTREKVLAGVDEAIEHLYETGDIQTAVRILGAFTKFEDMSGIARAKMLWGSQQWFVDTKQDGDFYEKFGITEKNNRTYTDRLIRLWNCIQDEQVPKAIQKQLTVRELMPITEALSQGYTISVSMWSKLTQAVDRTEIRAIIQEKVKNKQPRSHTMTFTIDDKGTIYMWLRNKKKFIGSLNLVDAETDPDLKKGIQRILEGKAIIKRI